MSSSPTLSTVFFDLDGTLADTAPDLAAALNQLFEQHGHKALPYEVIRPTVSMGGNAMLKLGFTIDEATQQFEQLRDEFLAIYDRRLHRDSRLFAGMAEVLDEIEAMGLRWGIITNKSTWLTEPLISELGLTSRTGCIVCGDSTAHRKPHPAPMFHACKLTGSLPQESVYVGDARRDIEAGKASGMQTLAAAWGYIEKEDFIDSWEADAVIQSPAGILEWLRQKR